MSILDARASVALDTLGAILAEARGGAYYVVAVRRCGLRLYRGGYRDAALAWKACCAMAELPWCERAFAVRGAYWASACDPGELADLELAAAWACYSPHPGAASEPAPSAA